MYSVPQHPREPSQIARLVLAKFSHTTTSIDHSGPLSWTHITGHGDIVAVFERYPALASASAGTWLKIFQNHEKLEEIDLSHFAREAQLRQAGNAKSPFAVMVKSPCLAMKYPRGGAHVRRFQIKFSSDGDYYTALAVLSDMKCPFSEPNRIPSRPPSRLASSAWHCGRVAPASASQEPFYAGSSASVFSNGGIFPSPANASVVGPNITETPLLSSSGTVCPLPNRTTSTMPGINQGHVNIAIQQDHLSSESGTIEQSSSNTASRPSTTATACHDIQTLNQLLPPKRELPFSKPGAKKAREGGKKPSNVDLQANESTESVTTTDTSKTKVNNNTSKRKTTRTPAEKAKPDLNPTTTATSELRRCHSSLPQLSLNNGERTSHSLHGPPLFSFQTGTQQQQQQQLEASYPSISGPHNTNNNINVTNNNINNNEEGRQTAPIQNDTTTTIPPHPQTRLLSDIITTTDLTSYLSTPASERATLVENWICEQIEDDAFLQLCQDVEGVWKRVAFGR